MGSGLSWKGIVMLDLLRDYGIEIDGDFITFGGMENILLFKKDFVDNEEDKRTDVVIRYGENDAMWVQFMAIDQGHGWELMAEYVEVWFVPRPLVDALIGMLDDVVWNNNVQSDDFAYGRELSNWWDVQKNHHAVGFSSMFDITCETYNEFWEEAEAFFS